jgi:putative ABC transport system permease protein
MGAGLRRFFLRLLAFFSSGRAERELERELADHLAHLEEEYQRRGMPAGEARLAARRALGGLDRAKEGHRDARSFRWLEDARRDARHALRGLARDRGFTVAALATLAVGIGATTAIFGGINAVLLRPLPLPQPERLLFVFEAFGTSGAQRARLTAPDFLDLSRQQTVFEGTAASAAASVTLAGSGDPVRVPALRVSADYFRVLGLRPALGRDLTEADDGFGAPPTVLVSHAFWRDRLGGDPSFLGRHLSLNGEPHTVIGVLPPGRGLSERTEQVYVPLALRPEERRSNGNRFLTVIGRLKPGVTREQARTELLAIARGIQAVRPGSNRNVSLRSEDVHEVLVGDLRRPLFFSLGAAVFLLLIACANVANLQLVRALARQREMAIRAALGAGRARLIRQLAMEGLVLAALGGTAGIGLAALSAQLIPWLIPGTEARMAGAFLDPRVLACSTLVSLATGVLFGLTPAWRLTRRDLRQRLSDSPRGATTGGSHRAGGLFAVVQVATALLLLIGAGLSIRSFIRLQAVDPGFVATGLLTFRLSLPEARYGAPGQTEAFHARLLEELRALPGVTSAAGTSALPLREDGPGLSAVIQGRTQPGGPGGDPFLSYRAVTPGYFSALGIPLLRGRDLSAGDRPGRPRVAVINRTAARRYWPEGDPIGARLKPDDAAGVVEIVGVVADTKHFGLDAEERPEMFIALPQISPALWRWNRRTFDFVVKTASAPVLAAASVRQTVRRLDPGLAVLELATMEEVLAESVASPRRSMLLLLASGAIALVLAALGLYGVISFVVAGRTQEIGVRLALGAARRHIFTLVLGRSARLCLLGLALGVLAALALSRTLATFLYGVTATDAATYATLSALLFLVSLAAAYLPARRALRVDPVTAMRGD